MRSLPRRIRETRARRRQEKLLAALEPVRLAVLRLAAAQQETRALVEQLALRPEPSLPAVVSPVQAEMQHRETQALLLELLDSLRPPAEEQVLSLLTGRQTPPPSSRSSVS